MFHYKPSTSIGWYWHIRQNDLGKPRMPSSGFIFAFCSAVLCQPLLIALGQPADVAYTSARYAQVQWLGVGQRSWYQHGFYYYTIWKQTSNGAISHKKMDFYMRNHHVTGFLFEKPPSNGIISIWHIVISLDNPLQNIAKPYMRYMFDCRGITDTKWRHVDWTCPTCSCILHVQIAPGVLIFFEALGRSILQAVQCSKYRVAIGQVHNAWLDHVPRLPVAGQPQKTQTLRLYVCWKHKALIGHDCWALIHGRQKLLIAQLRNLVSSPLQILLCCLAVDIAELQSCSEHAKNQCFPDDINWHQLTSWQQLTSTEHFALTRLEWVYFPKVSRPVPRSSCC